MPDSKTGTSIVYLHLVADVTKQVLTYTDTYTTLLVATDVLDLVDSQKTPYISCQRDGKRLRHTALGTEMCWPCMMTELSGIQWLRPG